MERKQGVNHETRILTSVNSRFIGVVEEVLILRCFGRDGSGRWWSCEKDQVSFCLFTSYSQVRRPTRKYRSPKNKGRVPATRKGDKGHGSP